MNYFQLLELPDDSSSPVSVPLSQFKEQRDIWSFSQGKSIQQDEPVQLEVLPGLSRDYTEAGFSIPIVTNAVRSVFETVSQKEVEFLQTNYKEQGLWVLNILSTLNCIDYSNSDLQLCNNKGRAFRHRYGKPEIVWNLVIHPPMDSDVNIFRVMDWSTAIVVSERLKRALQDANITGLRFSRV